MPPSPDGREGYSVQLSAAMARTMRQIQRQATRENRGEATVSALRQIIARLRREPWHFGEPLYRMPAMRMQVRCGGIPPLFVHFAVSEDRPQVFIKGITLRPQQST
jgi:hypothetical protein